MFAGTGFSTYQPQLNSNSKNKYDYENTFTGMIADISKVRIGDKILFYVIGIKKFFGFFQIASQPFFESQATNCLGAQLKKYLPFRVCIKPLKVYSQGVLEQIALDDISTISAPYQMCWSMIYRKLTGMRGCSFLTDYESDRIESLMDSENKSIVLQGDNFCYDSKAKEIAVSNIQNQYPGSTNTSLSINNRLFHVGGAHEGHVQAYIMQNYDSDHKLMSKLMPLAFIKSWIGNEVVCSVGEKRIDVLMCIETNNEIQIRVIELKDEYPLASVIINQIPWYINWVDQYVAPNLKSHNKPIRIIPTIFAYKRKRNTKSQQLFDNEVNKFNNKTTNMCKNAMVSSIDCIYFDKTSNPIKIY